MTEKSFIEINPNGEVTYVTEQRTVKSMNDDIISKIGRKSPVHMRCLFQSGLEPVGLISNSEMKFCYKFMPSLKINCQFKISAGILRPVYISESDKLSMAAAYPQFTADWVVPPTMRLMFAAKIFEEKSVPYTQPSHGCMLIAWSGKSAHRLPLPNLYDNCDMCTGKFDGTGDTVQQAFQKAVDQMEKSSWNSDLLDDMRQRNSDELFQFKPAGEGMTNSPYDGDWKKFCPTAGNVNIELLAGAL